jgi:hypothetical protein
MDAATRALVHDRAKNCCEYCGLRQEQSPLASLHVEHIIPRKHGGDDRVENLALACIDCNLRKGTNVAGFDPVTGQLTELFHPRHHVWTEHFARDRVFIFGKTPIGRTTVDVLQMNSEDQLDLRLFSRG